MNSQALQRAMQAIRTQRPQEAERLATEVLLAEPDSVHAARILGQSLLQQGRPAEAIGPLQRAADLVAEPETDILLARALEAVGRSGEALGRLGQATQRLPSLPQAFVELAGCLARRGSVEAAIAVFEEGLALTPDAVLLKVGLGWLHLGRRDRSKALALFAQAHAAEPERHDAMLALATATALDGDHLLAADLYRRALVLRPQDPMTRLNLGKSLLELGERKAGEAALREAVRSAPQLAALAITTLAAASHGRFLLRPSAAAEFLNAELGGGDHT